MRFTIFTFTGILIVVGIFHFFRAPTTPVFEPNSALVSTPTFSVQKKEPARPQPGEAAQEFSKLTEEAFKTLPRQEDAAAMDPETVSQLPPDFIARLQSLIDIGKAIKGNRELVDDGISFYRQCALDFGLHTAVRARCLSHFIKLSEENLKPVNVDEYDERILKSARLFSF